MAIVPRRGGYATDVTEAQWRVVAPVLARPAGPGRSTRVAVRQVLNALLYQARTGSPWRLLPQGFPHWTAVRYYFDKWAADGTWEEVNGRLVEQAREHRSRAAPPTAALIDSQSSKTTEAGGERGFDGGENNQRPQAALSGGYRRTSAGGAGRGRGSDGSRRRPVAVAG